MSPIERFEDLIAWQKARELTRKIYEITRQDAFARDFGLRDQIRRAAVSIMSNIAEGFARGSRGEFHQFFVISRGSCAEVQSQLYIALDAGYLTPNEFEKIYAQSLEVIRIISALRSSVQRQRDE